MPELPEVEAARRAAEEHCVGKKIVKAIIADDSKVIDGVSPKDFEASLLGKTIVAAYRKGKNMWLQLDSPPFPTFQFGMAGAIYIKGVAITKYKRAAVSDTDEWPSKYSKFFVEATYRKPVGTFTALTGAFFPSLNDGLELSFTDKRRFAKVRLLDNPVSVPPISELGPDALLDPMTVHEFYNSLKKKNIGIKALLLDQSFMSGIGNWMADEVLYQARIHPQQVASSMSKECCETLLKCINEVIEKAVGVGADSSQFPSNWIFHSREKKPGKASVDGKKIEFINAGGRTTAYVPELQKLIGNQSAKTGGRTRKDTKVENENVEDDLGDTGSEEGGKAKAKAKKKKSTVSKKPSTKTSKGSNNDSDENDDDDDDEGEQENLNEATERENPRGRNKSAKGSNKNDDSLTKRTRGRITPKRKSKGNESEPDDATVDGNDDDNDEDQDVINIKKAKKTKTAKASKRKDESTPKGKGVKKKKA